MLSAKLHAKDILNTWSAGHMCAAPSLSPALAFPMHVSRSGDPSCVKSQCPALVFHPVVVSHPGVVYLCPGLVSHGIPWCPLVSRVSSKFELCILAQSCVVVCGQTDKPQGTGQSSTISFVPGENALMLEGGKAVQRRAHV